MTGLKQFRTWYLEGDIQQVIVTEDNNNPRKKMRVCFVFFAFVMDINTSLFSLAF